jgi:hypothetical protein
MSKIGNHRVGMQENPLYEEGWKAFCKGVERDYVEDGQPFYAEDNAAWQLGWDDAEAAGILDGAKGGE